MRGSCLILSALFIVGCIPSLEPTAATGLPCEEEQIEIESIGFSQRAKGCGKEDIYLYDGGQQKWISLRDRASFEFACDKDEVEVRVLDSMSFGVTGCGHRAVYKTDWMHGFVMNSGDDRPRDERSSDDGPRKRPRSEKKTPAPAEEPPATKPAPAEEPGGQSL